MSREHRIVVAASFTGEPIAETLGFWFGQVGIRAAMEFAPFGQVFQQLFEPTSSVATNTSGVNIILLRLEDFSGRANDTETGPDTFPAIEKNVRQLVDALRAVAARGGTFLVCVNPSTVPWVTRAFANAMEDAIAEGLTGHTNVRLVRAADVLAKHPSAEYADPQASALAHIPYTPAYYATLGTVLAREIHRTVVPSKKAVLLDCDNTLWSGVCGEDGPRGIVLDPMREALQKFMLERQQRGMLLGICSRNNEEDVDEVFALRTELPLRREHFVATKINWLPKSENIKALATELNIGLDSFIFVDDDPVVCAEVQAACPDVVTLLLPTDVATIPRFLDSVWAFDTLPTTREDEARTALYREGVNRERLRNTSTSFADFLAALELKVTIQRAELGHASRVAQLTQRTNQFNASTVRQTVGEIESLLRSHEASCLVVEVSDRFGDYGLVGVAISHVEASALVVDTLLLSCRALGRGVEHRMIAALGAKAAEQNVDRVEVRFVPSAKNAPARAFLAGIPKVTVRNQESASIYEIPTAVAAALVLRPEEASKAPPEEALESPAEDETNEPMAMPHRVDWRRIATELFDTSRVLTAVTAAAERPREGLSEATFVAPTSPIEARLAEIWTSVLRIKGVGRDDDFFKLGGESLTLTQTLARILEDYGVELPLDVVLMSPTIGGMAKAIEEEQARTGKGVDRLETPADKRIPVTTQRELPISSYQLPYWMLNLIDPQSRANYVRVGLRLRGPLDTPALEGALDAIVKRHSVLRTVFKGEDASPLQLAVPQLASALARVDLGAVAEGAREQALLDAINRDFEKSFVFNQGPLFRFGLFRLGDADHVLLFTVHHIIFDASSIPMFIDELRSGYAALAAKQPIPTPPLPIHYLDYAAWEHDLRKGDAYKGEIEFWKKELENLPASLQAPPQVAATQETAHLSLEEYRNVEEIARREGCTPFIVLLAAFAATLAEREKDPDLLIGSLINNRRRPETRDLLGLLSDVFLARIRLGKAKTLRELLQHTRDVVVGAWAHPNVRLHELMRLAKIRRSPAHGAPVHALVNMRADWTARFELAGLDVTPMTFGADKQQGVYLDVVQGTNGVDLTLTPPKGREGVLRRLMELVGQLEQAPETPLVRP